MFFSRFQRHSLSKCARNKHKPKECENVSIFRNFCPPLSVCTALGRTKQMTSKMPNAPIISRVGWERWMAARLHKKRTRFEYVPRNNMSGGERENFGEREAPQPNSSYGPSLVRWLIIDYDVCRVGNSSSVNR